MADRLLPFPQREVPGLVFCEGCCPSALPKVGAAPPQPRDAGAPPCTRVTFPSRGKSPKARQGLCPLESPKGDASLPLRFPHPLDRACTTKIDRFATLRLWANRSYFFLWFHQRNTLCFHSVARQVPWLRGCRRFYTPATNTARAGSGGIQGDPPLVPEVQEPGGSWRIFAYFLYARK